MKEIIQSLKEIDENFMATTQAFGQLPNPIAGTNPTTSAHSSEEDKELKKEPEDAMKEHELNV